MVSTSVAETLDDIGNNSRYGGFVEKEARRKRREARLRKLGKDGMAKRPLRVAENPEWVHLLPRAKCESDAVSAELAGISSYMRMQAAKQRHLQA